jgi:hypothetical protein
MSIDPKAGTITWVSYEKLGGRISRTYELVDGAVRLGAVLTKEDPPVKDEELFVETIGGIAKMRVESVHNGVSGNLMSGSALGPMEFFPEDNEWRCLGTVNLKAIQKLELK